MNLIIPSLILLLVKSVKLDNNIRNYCGDVTGPNHEDIDLKTECGVGLPCLVKCCGPNEVIHFVNHIQKCKKIDQLGKEINITNIMEEINTYSGIPMNSPTIKEKRNIYQNYHLLYRKQFAANDDTCTYRIGNDKFNLTEKGDLDYLEKDLYDVVGEERKNSQAPNFCIEMMVGIMKKPIKAKALYVVFIKGKMNTSPPNKDEFIFYGYFVSAFFILLLLAVYGLLKELHSKLRGMMLMTFMGSLLINIVIGNAMNLRLYKLEHANDDEHVKDMYGPCKVLSPVTYFFLLSAFFWMNTMAFDIWWTFRSMRLVRKIHRRGINVKFLTYGLYAWGMPAVLVIIAVLIDYAPGVPASVAKPQFKLCQRDYGNYLAKWYKYAPMLVLVTANIVLYIMTIYNIWFVHCDTEKDFNKIDSKAINKNKNYFVVYFKLSVIMGLNWIFELVLELGTDKNLPMWLFYLMNVFNVLIGFVVFVIMVCKRSVFIMLCKRFNVENRWMRKSTHAKTNTRSQLSKSNTSCKTKVTEDSIQIISIADISKTDEQKPLNPRFLEDTSKTNEQKPLNPRFLENTPKTSLNVA